MQVLASVMHTVIMQCTQDLARSSGIGFGKVTDISLVVSFISSSQNVSKANMSKDIQEHKTSVRTRHLQFMFFHQISQLKLIYPEN